MVNTKTIAQVTADSIDESNPPKKVALLTAGGLAPCLSSAVGALITEYASKHPSTEIICYVNGYKGLLLGESVYVTPGIRATAGALHMHGGSPIGNSRVKLTNYKDCLKRGLIKEGEDPQRVAADQLIKDGVDVLHTIGGDDTNMAAADLAAFLAKENYKLCVIGLPKTIDNDVYPITQSLGAITAAEQGGRFFSNIVAESSANPKMMIVHEVMGRDCGWLTAATARAYREQLAKRPLLPTIGLTKDRLDVHGVYIPEIPIDLEKEAARLKEVLERNDNVNIFISEGAGVNDIVAEMERQGKQVMRDAFGHVKLDLINPGKYFADSFSALIGAEKVLVQKSGYFARAAPANDEDILLIQQTVELAVQQACKREGGVCAMDEDNGNKMSCIDFKRIKGSKPFNYKCEWFQKLLAEIGQQPASSA
mmetsp:Transcript_48499/g.120214  ORF Transcript_48499/g.120214 Transcript_48499/m.120214 type:complete len:423 (-) Transcript_48499:393-1661(-)